MWPDVSLTWSTPRLEAGDFAPEDPLAIDHLQQQLGNLLWPGFTSRTSRAFYYVMVCYGLRAIDDLLHHHGQPPTDDNRRAWFERWEKLWALAICTSYDGSIDPVDAMRGRNGVPLYLMYSPGSDRPAVLPELLTPGIVIGALADSRRAL